MVPEKLNIVSGSFISNAKGFGFVATEDKNEKDIFIPADSTNNAIHKDKVLVKITSQSSNGRRSEGEVIKVLEHGLKDIVGTFEQGKGFGLLFLMTKNLHRIFLFQ